jgi:hypothetical protein
LELIEETEIQARQDLGFGGFEVARSKMSRSLRDENSSRDMTNLMNFVESLTVETGAAVAFGSHYSKGNQAAKESMDRISGSGVFARDPDSIITMTQHEQNYCFAVEMTLRNFPPHEPFVVRREHPLMVADGKLDPAKLKKLSGRTPDYKPEDVLACLGDKMTTTHWQKACGEEGITRATFYQLKDQGKVKKSAVDETWMQNSCTGINKSQKSQKYQKGL